MDRYVIDLHCYKPRDWKVFIIKELAIYGVDISLAANFIVKPPRAYKPADKDLLYVRENIHGIEWHDGYVTFVDVIKIVRQVCGKAFYVYIKGSERVQYLQRVVFNEECSVIVCDLDWYNCPRFDSKQYNLPRCYYSKHLKLPSTEVSYTCALQKAYFYGQWIRDAKLPTLDVLAITGEVDESEGPIKIPTTV